MELAFTTVERSSLVKTTLLRHIKGSVSSDIHIDTGAYMAEGVVGHEKSLPVVWESGDKNPEAAISKRKLKPCSKKERCRKAFCTSLKKRKSVFRLNTPPRNRESRIYLPPIDSTYSDSTSSCKKEKRKCNTSDKDLSNKIGLQPNILSTELNRKGVHFTPAYSVTQTYSVTNLRNRTKENFAKRIAENSGKICIKDLFQKFQKTTENCSNKDVDDIRNKRECIFPEIRPISSPNSVDSLSDDESLSKFNVFQYRSQQVSRFVL